MKPNRWSVAGVGVLIIAGCAHEERKDEPAPAPAPPPAVVVSPTAPPEVMLREVFPHVRVDADRGLVEIDGTVPIDAHNDQTPRVYLEVMVCIPDTKEHETLVVTGAKPSHVHAALLLCGVEPGKPGAWDWEGKAVRAIPPTGPRVRVSVAYEREGREVESPLSSWVVNANTGARLSELSADAALVFAGSRMGRRGGAEVYQADGEGCLVGLTTFGGETIAWPDMFSPDSGVEQPQWIAGPGVPARGTSVIVRMRVQK